MSRLPLVPADADDPVVAEVFARFRAEGREPIALYRALANAPSLLRAYSGLATALRYEASTPRALRELAILRIAQLTGSRYEWCHHVPMARAAGVPQARIDALTEWQSSADYDERERAILRCADELHDCALSDETFQELHDVFGAPGSAELILLIAFYEAVARMIAGFGIEVEPDYEQHA